MYKRHFYNPFYAQKPTRRAVFRHGLLNEIKLFIHKLGSVTINMDPRDNFWDVKTLTSYTSGAPIASPCKTTRFTVLIKLLKQRTR